MADMTKVAMQITGFKMGMMSKLEKLEKKADMPPWLLPTLTGAGGLAAGYGAGKYLGDKGKEEPAYEEEMDMTPEQQAQLMALMQGYGGYGMAPGTLGGSGGYYG
jgi:hypothetical protein